MFGFVSRKTYDAKVAELALRVRKAFKAGWRTNAISEHEQSADYLDSCEQGDFEEYQRLGELFYLASLNSIPPEPQTDWEAKFKKAVTDLEGEVRERRCAERELVTIRVENARLAPLAKKYEDRLQRDRNRVRPSRAKSPAKAGKKESVS